MNGENSMVNDTLDNLARRVQEGKKEAFRDIIKETAVVIRAYISFYIDDKDIVDDVVQETYMCVYKEIRRYKADTNFMAWMKTIAKYKALAERRRLERKGTARKRYVQELTHRISEEALKQEETEPLEAKLNALNKCIEFLSDRVRNIVRMKYFQALNLSDIAQSLNMDVSSVGVTLHRARAALADCIDKRITK